MKYLTTFFLIGLLAIVLLLNSGSVSNMDQMPEDFKDYIYNEDYPEYYIQPINALSPNEFKTLLCNLESSNCYDQRSILIEAINL